jgi:hypothetical protein
MGWIRDEVECSASLTAERSRGSLRRGECSAESAEGAIWIGRLRNKFKLEWIRHEV